MEVWVVFKYFVNESGYGEVLEERLVAIFSSEEGAKAYKKDEEAKAVLEGFRIPRFCIQKFEVRDDDSRKHQ